MLIKILRLFFMSLLLSGCETISYTEDEVSKIKDGSLVVLVVSEYFGRSTPTLKVRYINDQKAPLTAFMAITDEYLLPVGDNKIEIACFGDYFNKYVNYTKELEFSTIPRKRYIISAKFNSDLSCFIKVKEEDEIKY